MKWRLYRMAMRVLHRFDLHYAPPNLALTNEGGWPLHSCKWCGMRDFIMPKLTPEEQDAVIARAGQGFSASSRKRNTSSSLESRSQE